MGAAVLRHFDALDYVDHSRALGVDEKVAKYQARQIEQVIEIATDNAINAAKTEVESQELVTKSDLNKLELRLDSKLQTLDSKLQTLDSKLQTMDSRVGQLEQKIEQTKAEIHKAKFDIVIWVAGLMVTLLVASGFMQHFLK